MSGADSKVQIFPHAPTKTEVPSLGFSMQVDLGAGRVCVLQTHLPNDCSAAELDGMLDKMTQAGDRQRAHYKIEELERDLAKLSQEQAQHKEDLARIESDYQAKVEERNAQMLVAQKSVDDFMDQAREAHGERGGRSAFALRGPDASRVNNVKTGITQLQADNDRALAERDVALRNSQATFDRRDKMMADLTAEIAQCRAIVGNRG